MSVVQISFEEGQANLDWLGLCQAFDRGHQLSRAEISDTFLYRGGCLLYTSPSPRDLSTSRMPSSA